MFKKRKSKRIVDTTVKSLQEGIGENLYSCILYGSMARGEYVEERSDINLLIVLQQSLAKDHLIIRKIINDNSPVNPFILSLKGIERSMKVFALKFMSVKRHYKILYGKDIFSEFTLDTALDKFLCEQSIRNLRLRLVHHFVMHSSERRGYSKYLERLIAPIFVDLSEAARIYGKEIPHHFADRISVLEETFETKLEVLNNLLALSKKPRVLSSQEIDDYHEKLFTLLDHVTFWIQDKWDLPLPGGD